VLYFLIHCSLHHTHFSCVMDGETDQTLLVAGDTAAIDDKTVSGVESDTTMTSSSSNAAAEKIVNKDVPMITDYWKNSTVTEVDRAAYHVIDWLAGGVESSITDLEFPMVDNTIVVCFESHPIAGLGLPPIKFLVSILNFLRST
jgi:hypothetical protein